MKSRDIGEDRPKISKKTANRYLESIDFYYSSGGTLPATPLGVCRYIAESSNSLSIDAIRSRIAVLSWWHRLMGCPDPTKHQWVSHTMRELHSFFAPSGVAVAPLVYRHLELIINRLDLSDSVMTTFSPKLLTPYRSAALLLLGFWGGLRFDELTYLKVENIEYRNDRLEIKVCSGAYFRTCILPALPYLCPVRAWRNWTRISGVSQGPLFTNFRGGTRSINEPIKPRTVKISVNRFARDTLEDKYTYGFDSLRCGCIVFLVDNGWTPKNICEYLHLPNLEYTENRIQRSKKLARIRLLDCTTDTHSLTSQPQQRKIASLLLAANFQQ